MIFKISIIEIKVGEKKCDIHIQNIRIEQQIIIIGDLKISTREQTIHEKKKKKKEEEKKTRQK